MIEQRGLFLHWELPLQSPHHALKYLSIGFESSIISGEVDIYAPTRQLRIDLPKRAHLVGADQNVAHSSGILKMFEVIKLALEAASTGGFRQMMGFIDDDGEGLTLKQCRFHSFAQFPGTYPRDLAIHKRIMEGAQDRPVIPLSLTLLARSE